MITIPLCHPALRPSTIAICSISSCSCTFSLFLDIREQLHLPMQPGSRSSQSPSTTPLPLSPLLLSACICWCCYDNLLMSWLLTFYLVIVSLPSLLVVASFLTTYPAMDWRPEVLICYGCNAGPPLELVEGAEMKNTREHEQLTASTHEGEAVNYDCVQRVFYETWCFGGIRPSRIIDLMVEYDNIKVCMVETSYDTCHGLLAVIFNHPPTGLVMDKLAYFRIKELKDVLTQLGLSKQGKKQDLVDRILAILSDERGLWAKKNAVGKEDVAKLVVMTLTADLASKSQAVSDSSTIRPKEETEDRHQMEKIRCLCGSTLPTDSMIKCEDPRCNVWQHMACVLIPEKPTEVPCLKIVLKFDYHLLAVTLAPAAQILVRALRKRFHLQERTGILSKQEYDVQAWCMLLNDKVPFRMQWPQYADLQVNGITSH
ncbi:E3 SUMO-protein ligase SIZ1 [Sesamum angolense]|uniref:E3 SUMO-protein ligase SIZ1 n=1 Tax=Sesamum angolense TaxID=2727404 RepID=A0AAE1XBX2_9LAMI|nr:E3 SUMO-protein ligase SIZ1 [Sesamum angolense]